MSFSSCGRYVACIDDSDSHEVTVYNLDRKCIILQMASGKGDILHLAWSKRPDDLRFAMVGPKQLQFWHPADVTKKLNQKGTFQKAVQTVLLCVAFDEEGWCYTGGENGFI